MKIQQRSLFFLANVFRDAKLWMAAILSAALLLFGCTTLTPDRVNALAAIAGAAAHIGAADWLKAHPEHLALFTAALAELTALAGAGITTSPTNAMAQVAVVERLSQLPTATLTGPHGSVYVRNADLVVWDGRKAVEVQGAATLPVLSAIRSGLRAALAPKPPLPPGLRYNP